MKNVKKEKAIMKKKKILSLLLSALMLLGCFPVTAVTFEEQPVFDTDRSETGEGNLSIAKEYDTQTHEFISDEMIGNVEEIVSLREENVKHFRLSNGSYEAVSFATAVHRKDKDGVWQNINNDLFLKKVGDKQGYFTDDMRTSFASSFKYGAELFSLSENGYRISMTPMNTGKITAETKQSPLAPVITNATKKASSTVFDSVEGAIQIDSKSSIVYNNIRENTDIEYVLDGNNIKENIIVKSKADRYEYAFQLSLIGLTAELDPCGFILIRDSKTEQVKYTIPAPFMYDGNGIYSDDVHYELLTASAEKYVLRIVASEEWIKSEGRVFPVTIDPSIESEMWIDTYINSESPSSSYASSSDMYASKTKTALIKPYIPNLPLNISSINSAELVVYYRCIDESFTVGVHGVTGMITETTTYNNAPSISANVSSTLYVEKTPNYTYSQVKEACFDITSLFSNWYYSGAIAYGIAIKHYSGPESTMHMKSSMTKTFPVLKVRYTQQIPDGVYAIKSVYGSSNWMTVENDSMLEGSNIQHMSSATSPVDSFDRSSLFKISGSDGFYIIRLMTNNNLTLAISNGKVVTKEIPSRDEDVPIEDRFSITVRATGYIIAPYNSGNVIVIGSMADEDLTTAPMSSTVTDMMRWTFEQYTGNHQGGTIITYPSSWGSIGIVDETTGSATLRGWSTYINANVLEMRIKPGYEDLGEVSWDGSENKVTVTATNPGRILIEYLRYYSNGDFSGTGDFYFIIVPEEGTYYIQNVDTGRYVDIDAGSSQSGAIIHQWQFHTEDQIKWIVEHVEGEGGYIRLKSARSNLYLGVDPANTSNIRQYAANDYTLWMIDRTDTGNVKLTNKATSGTEKVLAVPLNENQNGTDLTQISYTDNDNYRDEWEMYVILPFTVKLEVTYDHAYSSRYSNAQERITEEIRVLQERYLTEFGLLIEPSAPILFSSYADTECLADFDEVCTHAEDDLCFNSSTSREGEMEEYHHKNFYNILARISFPNTNQTLRTAFVGHDICSTVRDNNGTSISHNHNGIFGFSYYDLGLSMITNTEGMQKEIKTLIHEFGHHYNVEDHYGGSAKTTQEIDPTGELGYSEDCIWGENKEHGSVLSNYTMCDGCKRIIENNIGKYNH